MANTNAISQMTRAANQVSSNKSTANASAPDESFQGLLDKVSGTDTKETDSKETTGGGQNKTETPVFKEEPETETKNTAQPDLAALVIQSMVGEVNSDQGYAAAESPALTEQVSVTQTAALPTVEAQIPADVVSVPVSDTVPQVPVDTQQKAAAETPVLTDTKAEPKVEAKTEPKAEPKAEAALTTAETAEVIVKDNIKSSPSTVTDGTAASANQSDKPITLEKTSQEQPQQQQAGNNEQPKETAPEVVKDTKTAPAEKTTVNSEVKKEAEKVDVSPEPVTVKNAPVQDTEVVRIKVAEPFKQIDTKLMNQISDKVQDTVVLGKDELVIQLTPEHLGRIAIKISMTDDGVKVLLNCDNLKTQNLLADKATGIGKIVEENMNSPVTVEVKDDGYWNQQKDATDQHNNHSRQQEEQEKQSQDDTDVFIQQLRLGLGGQIAVS